MVILDFSEKDVIYKNGTDAFMRKSRKLYYQLKERVLKKGVTVRYLKTLLVNQGNEH